ncbi:hypothetical protein DFR86_10735 [Acidianus sulfidivorans JP7]|uniref:Uncharacterized protein n=1 Tax=Acidianus sulfidivorans JP7 TaxID=619593 RepID=A0A2U9IPN6_9CREN|nr:hypothetical protein [Acidianus sulfidivorans]AWR97963.1 hypothetical protein DFR86_10735 [Acidianus sulfidivorans JP7]
MNLEEYLEKKGFKLVKESETKSRIDMDDYSFYIEGNSIILPIPLPTGNENLDDLVAMGTKYARASRIAQGLGGPVEYKISENVLNIIKKYENRDILEEKLIKALEGIESLRYFM